MAQYALKLEFTTMPQTALKLRKKSKLILAVLLGSATLLVTVLWKPYWIYSHKRGMERAFELMRAEFDANGILVDRTTAWEQLEILVSRTPSDDSERFEFHRDALVKLGYLETLSLEFRHIHFGTEEAKRLFELVLSDLPNNPYTTMEWKSDTDRKDRQSPALIETILIRGKGEKALWVAFHRKYDVRDFRESYMTDTLAPAPKASK